MASDIVRLPNGKTVTRGRAFAMGWVDGDGSLTAKAPQSEADVKAEQKAARAEDWRRTQGLDEAEAVIAAARRKKIEPLRPRNVDHSGQPITDEETLARIAAETEALAAAGADARDVRRSEARGGGEEDASSAVSISVEDGEVSFTDIPADDEVETDVAGPEVDGDA